MMCNHSNLSKILLSLLIVGSLFSLGCTELSEYENKQVNKALSDSLFTLTESWDVEMEILEEGNLKLKLTGTRAVSIKNEAENITKISGPVHITIFNEDGIPETYVLADSANHLPGKSVFEMYGSVEVHTSGDRELRSDYLQWERNKDRVSTPEFVIFISPPDSIAAQGFFGNSDLTNYTLNQGGGRTIIE